MSRYAAFVLILFIGFEIHLSQGIIVSVKGTDDKLCLFANLMVNFTVEYETKDNKNAIAEFRIPDTFTSDGSSCGMKTSVLKINFGDGHSWSVDFSLSNNVYQAEFITFSYNLRDSTIFHDPLSNDTVTVKMQPHISDVVMDTSYSCNSKATIEKGVVNQTMSNVLIQAFVVDGSMSKTITSCSADLPVKSTTPTSTTPTSTTPTTTTPTTTTPTTTTPTTTTPTTTTPTTTTPTTTTPTTTTPTTTTPTSTTPTTTTSTSTTPTPTTHTTVAPVTNVTTLPPTTPTPTPPPSIPPIGKYSVKSDENATVPCLLADFGLRIGFKQGEKYEEMNLETNGTKVSGFCGGNSSELVLEFTTVTMVFSFISESQRFRLHALNVTGKMSSGVVFSEVNTNLSLWETALGSSYMCNKKQNNTITSKLSLFTFDLRVQPFGVKKGVFSTAQECSGDDTSILIPIIVGAALAGLILIVVIAYVIGRRKTYVGYQTL